MRIIFGRNNKIGSIAIRTFTWSRYSHVGIILEGDRVLEAIAGKGVIITPLVDFKKRYTVTEEATIEGTPEKALKQLGKKYDYTGVLGIAFRQKNWNDPDSWWCSELVAICSPVFRPSRISRITPEHIFMVSKGK